MLYRPSYCCNCGEKIERVDWRVWTSRRFCALCETEYKLYDLIPRGLVALGLILGLFGFASYFRSQDPEQPGRHLSTKSDRKSQQLKAVAPDPAPIGNVAAQDYSRQVPPSTVDGKIQINEQPKKEKLTSDESVFYCGAITKKGTPCTRRVKKQGFCWQHAKSSQVAPARS